jgi:hypothetical protein
MLTSTLLLVSPSSLSYLGVDENLKHLINKEFGTDILSINLIPGVV